MSINNTGVFSSAYLILIFPSYWYDWKKKHTWWFLPPKECHLVTRGKYVFIHARWAHANIYALAMPKFSLNEKLNKNQHS